jgi:hypothetical protein
MEAELKTWKRRSYGVRAEARWEPWLRGATPRAARRSKMTLSIPKVCDGIQGVS